MAKPNDRKNIFYSTEWRTINLFWSCYSKKISGDCRYTLFLEGLNLIFRGHCTFKNGKYMRDFVFIPAFDNGVAPYGVWSFHQAFVSPSWLSYSKVPNEGDWTIFVVKDKLSRGQQISIGDCLGWFGISTNNLVDNHVTSLGYADNFDFGARMHQV